MATATFYPTAVDAGSSWTSTSNIYADDTSFASITASSKNTDYPLIGNTFKTSGAVTIADTIPSWATINSVTITANHYNNASDSSGPLFWLIAYDGGTTIGTGTQDTTHTGAEEVYTYDGTAPTVTQLRSSTFKVSAVFRRTDNTAHVHYCDYIKVVVDYSLRITTTASTAALISQNAVLGKTAGAVNMATTSSTVALTVSQTPTAWVFQPYVSAAVALTALDTIAQRDRSAKTETTSASLTASNAVLDKSTLSTPLTTTASTGALTVDTSLVHFDYVIENRSMTVSLTAANAVLSKQGVIELTTVLASAALTASGAVALRDRSLQTTASAVALTAATARTMLSPKTVAATAALSSSTSIARRQRSLLTTAATAALTTAAARTAIMPRTTASSAALTTQTAILLRTRSLITTASTAALTAPAAVLLRARLLITTSSSGQLSSLTSVLSKRGAVEVLTLAATAALTTASSIVRRARPLATTASSAALSSSTSIIQRGRRALTTASSGALTSQTSIMLRTRRLLSVASTAALTTQTSISLRTRRLLTTASTAALTTGTSIANRLRRLLTTSSSGTLTTQTALLNETGSVVLTMVAASASLSSSTATTLRLRKLLTTASSGALSSNTSVLNKSGAGEATWGVGDTEALLASLTSGSVLSRYAYEPYVSASGALTASSATLGKTTAVYLTTIHPVSPITELVGAYATGSSPGTNVPEVEAWEDLQHRAGAVLLGFDFDSSDGWVGSNSNDDPYALRSDGDSSIVLTSESSYKDTDFTVEVFVYVPEAVDATRYLIYNRDPAMPTGFSLKLEPLESEPVWLVGDGENVIPYASGTGVVSGWHQLALSWHGGVLSTYADGALVASEVAGYTAKSAGQLVLGAKDELGTNGCACSIASFRYWDETITEAEIARDWSNGPLAALEEVASFSLSTATLTTDWIVYTDPSLGALHTTTTRLLKNVKQPQTTAATASLVASAATLRFIPHLSAPVFSLTTASSTLGRTRNLRTTAASLALTASSSAASSHPQPVLHLLPSTGGLTTSTSGLAVAYSCSTTPSSVAVTSSSSSLARERSLTSSVSTASLSVAEVHLSTSGYVSLWPLTSSATLASSTVRLYSFRLGAGRMRHLTTRKPISILSPGGKVAHITETNAIRSLKKWP